MRGLSTERNLHFKIDWASLIVGSKFTGFFCCTLCLREIFKVKPPLEGRFNGGSFWVTGLGGLYLEQLIHGGAYFQNFTVVHVWFLSQKPWMCEKPQGLGKANP